MELGDIPLFVFCVTGSVFFVLATIGATMEPDDIPLLVFCVTGSVFFVLATIAYAIWVIG